MRSACAAADPQAMCACVRVDGDNRPMMQIYMDGVIALPGFGSALMIEFTQLRGTLRSKCRDRNIRLVEFWLHSVPDKVCPWRAAQRRGGVRRCTLAIRMIIYRYRALRAHRLPSTKGAASMSWPLKIATVLCRCAKQRRSVRERTRSSARMAAACGVLCHATP